MKTMDGIISDFLKPTADAKKENVFDKILDATVRLFDDTNAAQKDAEAAQMSFAAGESDDVLAVIMAEQKALSCLNVTVQLMNRTIEAYKEVMRMQF
ncbi:MAG: flagellar hook-basal body complex protein FliE [Clostridiales bacterium]|nr:flagellar hook-basal body complex protein FliE [Clostridiales bacterium]